MKKMMIALAAVAACVVANAATIKWNTGTVYAVNADGSWDTSTKGASAEGSFAFTAYLYDTDGTTLLESMANSGWSLSKASGTFTGTYNNSQTYYVALEATYTTTAGTQTFTATDAVAYSMPGTGNGTPNFTTLGVINTSATQFTAVPEPTSGLLLLLGMAGLALKRKIA